MKKVISIRILRSPCIYLMFILMAGSCDQDNEAILQGDFPPLSGEQKEYSLITTASIESIGTALFLETENNTTVLSLKLLNLPPDTYQVMIKEGSYAGNGDLILTVGMLDTEDGFFEKEIIRDDQNNSITYREMMELDAHIRITGQHQSFDIVSDIGVNELTGKYTTFSVIPVEDQEASGTIEIHERLSGSSMIRTIYDNNPGSHDHPVRLFSGPFNAGGELLINLNEIKAGKGFSDSHADSLNTGEQLTYDQLITYDGHISIHLSNSSPSVILAASELGSAD